VHDAWPAVAPALGEVSLEETRRLDDVVIDADEDQIFDLHANSDRNEL
jgi:hypothetical protein